MQSRMASQKATDEMSEISLFISYNTQNGLCIKNKMKVENYIFYNLYISDYLNKMRVCFLESHFYSLLKEKNGK